MKLVSSSFSSTSGLPLMFVTNCAFKVANFHGFMFKPEGHYVALSFLGGYVKLRKRPLASSCSSVRMEQIGFYWAYFDKFSYLNFSQICRANSSWVKMRRE
jgi:hypothetical protein